MKSGAQQFLLTVLVTVLLLALPDLGLILYLGYPVGDMVRIGAFPSRDWRPHREQAPLARVTNHYRVDEADVIILGDSFSRYLLWQSEFEAKSHLKTITYHYSDVGSIHDFLVFLQGKSLKPGAVLIVELVEREFVSRILNLPSQTFNLPIPDRVMHLPTIRDSYKTFKIDVDLSYAWSLLTNIWTDHGQDGRISNGVKCVTLNTSSLFTNRRSDRMLYYLQDDQKRQWTKEQVDRCFQNLLPIKEQLSARGINFLIVVVPDKSSVYQKYFQDPSPSGENIEARVVEERLCPFNLLEVFQSQCSLITDLYLPDDSHLGNEGYRLLGEIVAKSLSQD